MATRRKADAQPAAAAAVVVSYKGFGPDWKCRDFQYSLGEAFEHAGKVAACEGGFHACENPLDVFKYYPPAGSRFAVVEQSGDLSRHGDDSKIASSRIHVKAEIDIAGLIKAGIEWTFAKALPVDPASPASATGYSGAAIATGYSGAASATGARGAASATGTRGVASATGDSGAASATGYSGAASATGDSGAASATGDSGAAIATGARGAASATGDSGAASATGDSGAAMASGRFGRALGAEGCALFLVERDANWEVVNVWAGVAGREGVKANTWYTLTEGKPCEVAA